jgi:hypothetical protein
MYRSEENTGIINELVPSKQECEILWICSTIGRAYSESEL